MALLQGRTALVTGAAGGIGRGYALALAQAGARVVCADIQRPGAEETAQMIEEVGGQSLAVEVDVSAETSTRACGQAMDDAYGGVDILVNNAAIYHGIQMTPQMDVAIGYWRQVMAVNLDGALLMTQALAPAMIRKGWGRVVNQSSIAAYGGYGGIYSVSKLALVGLTQGFARELGPHGITVNAIAPGVIHTDATRNVVPQQAIDALQSQTPLAGQAQPDALVGTLLYLVTDAGAWTTGQTIVVDGGLTPRI